MRLGIGSYTYPWGVGVAGHRPPRPLTHAELLDRAVELGVRVVQLCDNLPLEALDAGELDRLERQARQRGIQIELGTRGLTDERVRRHLELAERFGARILRMVVDDGDWRPGPDRIVEVAQSVLPELRRAGVCLAIENHDRLSADVLAGIFERLDRRHVGLCLDTVNSFGCLEGPAAVLDRLAPYVVNLHLKDFRVRRADHMLGFAVEGVPAGQGQLNVPWLLERLGPRGSDVSAIIEQWPPPEPTLEQTIAKEAQWARQSVEHLRTLITD